MYGPSQRWRGSWMISRSANSSRRNGSTSSRFAGPPRFIITMPVFTLPISPIYTPAPSRPPHGSGEQPLLQRDLGEPRDGVHIELPHQALAVALHRAVTDPQL